MPAGMVNWTQLQNATSPDNKPTPGWLFHEICLDVRACPKDVPDIAEYLMQCVCSDQLNVQLKAVLAIKHIAAEDITFQQYMQACAGAIKIMEDIAAPPIVAQARSLEPQEVKTVRDATKTALDSIRTPHSVEKKVEAQNIKQRIQGFGNFEPPPEEQPAKASGVTGQAAEFVADSIGDMVDDFREKGAVGALKDATIDALDLVLDGVDAVWGWVAGKPDDKDQRICQPAGQVPGAAGGAAFPAGQFGGAQGSGFAPPAPAAPPSSASNHYAAAFGGGVVGANNPVMVAGLPAPGMPGGLPSGLPGGAMPAAPAPQAAAPAAPQAAEEPPKPAPAPMVDLLSMDEPSEQAAKPSAATVPDLL